MAIYADTPPHRVERVIMPFPCSALSPQRSLSSQYDISTTDGDDDYSTDDVDDVDDILSQWSMSPGPPSPRSDTSLQRSLNSPRDSNTGSSVNGGCNGGDVKSSISEVRCYNVTALITSCSCYIITQDYELWSGIPKVRWFNSTWTFVSCSITVWQQCRQLWWQR